MARVVLLRDQQIGDKTNNGEIIYPITSTDACFLPTTTIYTTTYYYATTTDEDGNTTSVSVTVTSTTTDDDGNTTTVYTDTDGNTYTVVTDEDGNVTSSTVTDSDGNTTEVTLDVSTDIDEENSESTTIGSGTSLTEELTDSDSALNEILSDNVTEDIIETLTSDEDSTLSTTIETFISEYLSSTLASTLDEWYIEALGYTYGSSGYTSVSDALTDYLNSNFSQYWSLSSGVLSLNTNDNTINSVTISKATKLSSTLEVSGDTTLSSKLEVSGATTLSSTLAVSGITTFAANVTFSGWGTSTSVVSLSSPSQYYFATSYNEGTTYAPELIIANNGDSGLNKVYIGRTTSGGTCCTYIGTVSAQKGNGVHYIQIGGYKASGYDSTSNYIGGVASYATQSLGIYCATTFYSTAAYSSSDVNRKQNIEAISEAKKAALEKVEFKEFEYKANPGVKHVGVIAQELQELGLDDVISTDNEGMLTVDYNSLFALKLAQLDAAIKEYKHSKKVLCKRHG